MANTEYTYCGFTLDAILTMPQWHKAALAEAQQYVQSCEAFARIDQCEQTTLERARNKLDALEHALALHI